MSKFLDGFLQGAQTQKLNNNHRTMKQMSSVITDGVVQQVKQQRTIQELEDELNDYKYGHDSLQAHVKSEKARSDYLMGLLDQVHGVESNPARQVAHPGRDFRIPSGDRKGEEVTKADEVYLNRFAEIFEELYASKWGKHFKTWIEFLNFRISI